MTTSKVPADGRTARLWGPSTERAVAAFPVSGRPLPDRFVRTLGLVKQAAAQTNGELGLLPAPLADAISRAAGEIAAGQHADAFPVDVYQTGSGTSTNMNANEVIASLAGRYLPAGCAVHPNDHVNRCQSSNDVIPTTMQLAAAAALTDRLLPALDRLGRELAGKAEELWPVVKVARTHLQEATPIRLGQELHGYAGQVEESRRRVREAVDELRYVPLGGTAAGTGINCHPEFAARTCARLADRTGVRVEECRNHYHAQGSLDAVVAAHGLVKTVGLTMWKVASDLRLLATGPGSGPAEIAVPDAGVNSSIMPGKAPPAVLESVTMVAARVVGNDATISFAQTGSLLELNVMMPVAADTLLESIDLLAAAADNLAGRCVAGLRSTAPGVEAVAASPLLATALSPVIGYDAAGRIAAEAAASGRTVREVALGHGLPAEQLDRLLDPERLADGG